MIWYTFLNPTIAHAHKSKTFFPISWHDILLRHWFGWKKQKYTLNKFLLRHITIQLYGLYYYTLLNCMKE